jgi:tetraacyldisaccharide 4'-kinase
LAFALWPLSVIYAALMALRRHSYRLGLLRAHRVPALVVVVGNVVVGGSGKTPMVLELARHLHKRGLAVGVVSRGYARRGQACLEVQTGMQASQCGDEPLLLKRVLGIPIFVARERAQAAQEMLRRYPQIQVILCDDGLQHLALARDIEVCMFDASTLGNGWLLPAGPLREPWPRAADFVVGPQPPQRPGHYQIRRALSNLAVSSDGQSVPLAQLRGQRVLALAAIAHPEPFFDMLRGLGLVLEQTFALPDHDPLVAWTPPPELALPLLITEKDAVKLWPRRPDALAARLTVLLDDAFWSAFDTLIEAKLSSPPRTATQVRHG